MNKRCVARAIGIYDVGMSKPASNNSQQIMQSPVAQPSPPVTATAPDVLQAKLDVQRQGMMRKNIKRTVMAGDTAGAPPVGPGGNPFQDAPLKTPKRG